jgi:hypothetical protein
MVVQKSKEAGGISFKPSEGSEGGGLLDNVDVVWKECRLKMWDYNGTQPETPALRIDMELENGDSATQYFSMGNIAKEDYKINEDETGLIKTVKTPRSLAKSSNFLILMDSLVKADFPEDKLENDSSIFDGLECHMVRVKAPERKGLPPKKPRADGKVYEAMNFVVDVIHKFPWDKKGSTKGKKEEASDEVAEKTSAAILEILEANPKGMAKAKLAGAVFNKLKGDKDAMAAAQLANKDEFLKEGMWNYEKGVVSPA